MTQKLTAQALAELETKHPPAVTIKKLGRWSYFLELTHGLIRVDCWIVLGEKRARKVARRKLGQYKRGQARIEEFGYQVIR